MAPVLVHVERTLKRPEFRPVQSEALAAADPILVDVPADFIRYHIEGLGPGLLEIRNATKMRTIRTEEMPTHLQIICRDLNEEPPTHIIAAYSDKFRVSETTFFPVHALALASACANLPPFPPSGAPLSLMEDLAVVTIPVVTLKVPSQAAFRQLLPYLYTNKSNTVLAELLPFEDDGDEKYYTIGIRHAKSFSITELFEDAKKIYAIWRTAADLGIGDEILYNTLEMAWEICMTALSKGHQQNVEEGIDLLI